MGKDSKGHGSNSRGGAPGAINARGDTFKPRDQRLFSGANTKPTRIGKEGVPPGRLPISDGSGGFLTPAQARKDLAEFEKNHAAHTARAEAFAKLGDKKSSKEYAKRAENSAAAAAMYRKHLGDKD